MIRVLIVDDHTVVRKGIQMILNTEPNIQVVGEAESVPEAVRQVAQLQPDIVLMDLVMPPYDGIEAIIETKKVCPEVKVIVLTTFEDKEKVDRAIQAGVNGYLLKDADGEALLQAIEAAQKGGFPLHPRIARHLIKNDLQSVEPEKPDDLTGREKDVLPLVARGLSNKAIAEELQVSEGTVKIHVSNILGKLGVASRTEAAVMAIRTGLVSSEEEII